MQRASFRWKSTCEYTDPVNKIEQYKHGWDDIDHDPFDRLSFWFFAQPHAVEHEGELKEDKEDEDDAHQHPDVQETHVADLETNQHQVCGRSSKVPPSGALNKVL